MLTFRIADVTVIALLLSLSCLCNGQLPQQYALPQLGYNFPQTAAYNPLLTSMPLQQNYLQPQQQAAFLPQTAASTYPAQYGNMQAAPMASYNPIQMPHFQMDNNGMFPQVPQLVARDLNNPSTQQQNNMVPTGSQQQQTPVTTGIMQQPAQDQSVGNTVQTGSPSLMQGQQQYSPYTAAVQQQPAPMMNTGYINPSLGYNPQQQQVAPAMNGGYGALGQQGYIG